MPGKPWFSLKYPKQVCSGVGLSLAPPPPPRDPGPQHTLLLIFFFKAEHANLAGTKLDPLHQTLIHGAGGVVNLGYRGWG